MNYIIKASHLVTQFNLCLSLPNQTMLYTHIWIHLASSGFTTDDTPGHPHLQHLRGNLANTPPPPTWTHLRVAVHAVHIVVCHTGNVSGHLTAEQPMITWSKTYKVDLGHYNPSLYTSIGVISYNSIYNR